MTICLFLKKSLLARHPLEISCLFALFFSLETKKKAWNISNKLLLVGTYVSGNRKKVFCD